MPLKQVLLGTALATAPATSAHATIQFSPTGASLALPASGLLGLGWLVRRCPRSS